MDGILDGVDARVRPGREKPLVTSPRCSVAGLDLHLDRPGGRARDSVMDAVRDAIRSGRLAPGTRLPSSRALAADLGIARNTVARAYAELITEGWLTSHHGSSTLVSQRAAEIVRSVAAPPTRPAPRRLDHDLRPGIRTCRRFPGRSGAARSSAHWTRPRMRRSAMPTRMVGRSFAVPLPSISPALAEFGPDRATSSCAAVPLKD